jgi:hypothetical protein
MTIFLDIAALTVLLLVLTFVPALGLRAEARITRQLREADAARAAEAGRTRPATARPARPARAADARRTERPAARAMTPSGV